MGIVSAMFFALLPFFTLGYLLYGDVNSKVFLVTLVVDLLLLFAGYRLYAGKITLSLTKRWLVGALGVVIVTQYLSAFFGVFPEHSLWSNIFWSTGVFFLTHLAVLAVLLAELLNAKEWSLVRKTIALSAGTLSALSFIGINGLGATGHFLWINLGQGSLTLGNETYTGAYLLLGFIFGLIELGRSEKKSVWRRVLIVSSVLTVLSPLMIEIGLLLGRTPLAAVIQDPFLLLGLARASSAALFVFLFYLAGYVLARRFLPTSMRTIGVLLWSATVLGSVVIGTTLLFTPGSAVQTEYISESSAARIIVWDASWEAFMARPVFGWGPENFNHAIEQHFDNRLFQEENLAEIWFERAHNVFLDTLVGTGVVGAGALTLLIVVFLLTVYRARKKGVISDTEAMLLMAVVPVHLLQMQTAFDTVGSYTLLAIMLGYVLSLERSMAGSSTKSMSPVARKVLAGVLVVFALTSIKLFVFDEYGRQEALIRTLTSRNVLEQKAAIEQSLSRVSSFESLRLSSASFIKGALATLVENPTPAKTKVVLDFLSIYETHYQTYLALQPHHYRARVNYAYLLLLKTTLGEDRLTEAKTVIRDSYALSPGNPITYILDSVAELYGGNVAEADRLMKEALAINPEIEFTQQAAAYLETQKRQFPNISVLKLTNL